MQDTIVLVALVKILQLTESPAMNVLPDPTVPKVQICTNCVHPARTRHLQERRHAICARKALFVQGGERPSLKCALLDTIALSRDKKWQIQCPCNAALDITVLQAR